MDQTHTGWRFREWLGYSLELNALQTNKIIIDYRRTNILIHPLSVKGMTVDESESLIPEYNNFK